MAFSGKEEKLKYREAYEYFYAMGGSRNLKKVAEKFGVSVKSIHNWSTAFNWQDRVTQRDIEISRGMEKRTNRDIINEKANYRKIVKAAIYSFAERLKDKVIQPENIQDLERLIKLDLLLMGEKNEPDEPQKEIIIKIEGV